MVRVSGRLVGRVLIAAAACLTLTTFPAARATTESFDDLLELALATSPDVRAANHAREAAEARVPAAGVRPDPKLTVGAFIENVETRVGPQEQVVGVSQAIPWPGTLRLREQGARHDAEVARHRLETVRRQVALELTRAWTDLWLVARELEITEETLEVLRRVEEIARTRYKVDAASHPDVIRVQVEIGLVEDRRRRLADALAPRAAAVNAVLGRAHDAPLPTPAPPPARPLDVAAETLRAEIRDAHPSLLQLAAGAEGARTDAALARRALSPDLGFGLTYTRVGEARFANVPGSGDDALLATVTLTIPVQRTRRRAEITSARERALAIEAEREGQRARLSARLQDALYEHDDALRRVQLYRDDLVPRTRDSLRASVRAYAAGRSEFLDLLDAERTLLELSNLEARARADLAVASARVEALVGRQLPRRAGRTEDVR